MKIVLSTVTIRSDALPVVDVHGVFEENAAEYELAHIPNEDGIMKRRSTDSMTTAHRAAEVRFDRLMETLRNREGHSPVKVENKFASIPAVFSQNEILRYSVLTLRHRDEETVKIIMQINRTEHA
jgi:phage portal protein BeeE